jgi:hypothetical protein
MVSSGFLRRVALSNLTLQGLDLHFYNIKMDSKENAIFGFGSIG